MGIMGKGLAEDAAQQVGLCLRLVSCVQPGKGLDD
jgi:hypothetical protein